MRETEALRENNSPRATLTTTQPTHIAVIKQNNKRKFCKLFDNIPQHQSLILILHHMAEKLITVPVSNVTFTFSLDIPIKFHKGFHHLTKNISH
jgi:hypothetical protein